MPQAKNHWSDKPATGDTEGTAPKLEQGRPSAFRLWRGASGTAYMHTVYTLIECPEMPPAVYIFVRRSPSGRRKLLRIARVESDAPSLNLAEIRHRGANLGANEVHLHVLASDEAARRAVELDLQARHFRSLAKEPAPAGEESA